MNKGIFAAKASLIGLVFLASSGFSIAQDKTAQEENSRTVMESVKWQNGPCNASLGDVAELRVPIGYMFAGGADTKKIMEVMGNIPSDEEVGFLAPGAIDWFVVYEFSEVGFIKDDEKNSLNADALLKSIRKSTEEGNKLRKKRGFPIMLNITWLTKPYYDELTHNLEWSIQGEDEKGGKFVNHNTRLLGRKGMMVVTLVADPSNITAVLPDFKSSLKDFSFKTGNTYAEFRQGDKLAAYGLTALVAGGATAVAVKTGLFKYIWKFLIFIAAGLAAFFKRVWARIKGFFRSEDKPYR
jgi:uncharacterized membrane-anchored protein